MADAQPGAELPEGTLLLDRYEIIDRVADGGMASIYRATDDRLDRVVCVKLLRLVLEDSGSAGGGGSIYQATYSHFQTEALALSKLQHPNTLRIYDFGYLGGTSEQSGRPFQISEYLDGGNLDSHVRVRGALTADETSAILDRICGAVAEAHEHRIIHRDIKPSNILFARVGDVLMPKLADFGIAQSELRKQRRPAERARPLEKEDVDDGSAVSTIALFSPRWAAPEQLSGGVQGAHTDVYALGLLAMFMLTGRTPFDDKEVRATFNHRVRSDDLLFSRFEERGIGDQVRRVLRAALRADPAARMSSPAELSELLRAALGVGPAVLPPAVFERKRSGSVTLETVTQRIGQPEAAVAPPKEKSITIGQYRVRLVEVVETLDFTQERATPYGTAETRFRVTMLPSANGPLRINIKGLNCFVALPGQRPTPAIVATETNPDAGVDFIAASRERIGGVSWSFGTPAHDGRVFVVDGEELVLPYREASHAVALQIGADRELIVMCRRT